MIPVRCPHCQVGLKVDETKMPSHITSFKCPKCKEAIPVSLIPKSGKEESEDVETIVLFPKQKKFGSLTVVADKDTLEQFFPLMEGVSVVGRKSSASSANIMIDTKDRSMSRTHLCIEVVKDEKGGYKHLLSDNNSKNNTLYNGAYLEKSEVVVLKDKDMLTLGNTVLRFDKS